MALQERNEANASGVSKFNDMKMGCVSPALEKWSFHKSLAWLVNSPLVKEDSYLPLVYDSKDLSEAVLAGRLYVVRAGLA